MTREEAKEWKIIDTSNGVTYSLEKLIDKIYDDFESKNCESCKYWSEDLEVRKSFGLCNADDCKIFTDTYDFEVDTWMYTHKTFLCNKWEKKQ